MSYADIVPQDSQERLIQYGDDISDAEWEIGDEIARIIAWNHQNEKPTKIMEVYAAAGVFIKKSARTARDYHDVACFYPSEIRDEYRVLSFSHFRQAMTLGSNFEKALAWALDQMDEMGRPASVDAMVVNFMSGAVPPEEDEQVIDDCSDFDEEVSPPPVSVTMKSALVTVRRCVDALPFNPSVREQLEEALLVLETALQAVHIAS